MFQSANYRIFVSKLQDGALLDALQALEKQTRHSSLSDRESVLRQIDNILNNYRALLAYKARGIQDSDYLSVFAGFWKRSYSLFLRVNSPAPITADGADVLLKAKDRLEHDLQQLTFLSLSGETNRDILLRARKAVETDELRIFHIIYPAPGGNIFLHPEWTQAESDAVRSLFLSELVTPQEQQLFEYAVMLSLLCAFDFNKFVLLRTVVPIAIVAYTHRFLLNTLITTYPQIVPPSLPQVKPDDLIVLQSFLFRLESNQQLQQQLRQEILPNLISTGLGEHHFISIEEVEELLDPENDDFADDPQRSGRRQNLQDHIRQLIELQDSGADLYYTTFRHAKRGPFFDDAANWFLPFNPWHTAISDLMTSENGSAIQSLLEKNEVCDSDLYSFALIIQQMVGTQGAELTEHLRPLLQDALNLDDRIKSKCDQATETDPHAQTKFQLWNCYRFFNLYKGGDNPFHNSLNSYLHSTARTDGGIMLLSRSELFKPLLASAHTSLSLSQLARQSAPQAALSYLDLCLESKEQLSPDEHIQALLMRCRLLEEQGLYHEAAERFEQLRKLTALCPADLECYANCLKRDKQDTRALDVYRTLALQNPSSGRYRLIYGLFLIQTEHYDDALEQFLLLELKQPDNKKLWRAIAWCLLCLGKAADSETRYSLLLDQAPTPLDYLNAGHAALAIGNNALAIARYKTYHELADANKPFSMKASDVRLLQRVYNIAPVDCQMLTDLINIPA